jgi:hypothetical protein
MIPADKTESLVKQSIERIRASVQNERIDTAFLYEDFLAADQMRHTRKFTGCGGERYKEMVKLAFPFTDTIINELSKTYKHAPRRYFDSQKPGRASGGQWQRSPYDEAVARWHELAENDEADYTPTLRMLDKRTRLHGRCLVRAWAAFPRAAVPDTENYPRFDVYHPGQFDVLCHPDYPARPVAVILYLSSADAGSGENRAQIWTPDAITDIINDKAQAPVDNPVKALPFVGFSNYIDQQEYWRAGLGRKIVRNNAIFDLGWTHLFGMAIDQAHGIPYAKDPDPKWAKKPDWSWDQIVKLSENGEFGFANAAANIDGFVAVLEKLVERTYWSCGLPTNVFKQDAGVESGAAYRVKNASILEDREERASLFAPRERALWRMAFLVGAAFGMHSLPGQPKSIIIDYAEPEIPVPQQEALAQRDADLKAGLISMVDEYRRLNPDTGSDEQALEELRYNAGVNAEFLGLSPKATLRDLVAAAKGAKKSEPPADTSEPDQDEEDQQP